MVDLETTGLPGQAGAEILELGAVLLDPDREEVRTLSVLFRPAAPLPPLVVRITGIRDEDVAGAATATELAPALRALLEGRVIVAHNADFERHFLARQIDPELARATFLDSLDLLALAHPDAPDLRLESFTRELLGSEEHHRALDDALDTARILARIARAAASGERRYVLARRALERFAPDSAWLDLLAKSGDREGEAPPEPRYLEIGESFEPPVPFDPEAIAAALGDEARCRRHLPGYRARPEQIRLARHFARHLERGGVLLLEGGTGVGKSLAYLAAAIPFAMARHRGGPPAPVVISTRTRLLQDQLLTKDIAAAARLLGHPALRAVSIKGRANYACERSLRGVLEEGLEPRIFAEDRLAYAALEACARIRPHGEIGTLPAALLRRYPPLRDLRRRAVAARAEQCTREQCAGFPTCALGRRRASLADAHLVVANHDLLLRWPADYPSFEHVIADEVHELAAVADEVFAILVEPEEIVDRFDELVGTPSRRGSGLLPRAVRRRLGRDPVAWRRALHQSLQELGRALAEAAPYGSVELPRLSPALQREAREAAADAADRLERIAGELRRAAESAPEEPAPEVTGRVAALVDAARALRMPFGEEAERYVASVEGIEPPYDRWRLALRPVSPADLFHESFLERLSSFAGVSASLFVDGDEFAALGSLELHRAGRVERVSEPSPFPYADHMRVLAMHGPADLVEETAAVLLELARRLRGRTLGLFTSLARMNQVAEILAPELQAEGIELLLPRRGTDDPSALVERFGSTSSVLLGARRFWQGLDLPGDKLQAVVIEKLPFEVPGELRRRRRARLEEAGLRDGFGRFELGTMLLNLKQMAGRLIRGEEDRGLLVIVDARPEKAYFERLREALPGEPPIAVGGRERIGELLSELGLPREAAAPGADRKTPASEVGDR